MVVSQDPTNYRDAPTEGIRRVLETVTGTSIPRGEVLKTDKIGSYALSAHFNRLSCSWADYIRLSTTVATNALLERKGHKHALIITKGFKVNNNTQSFQLRRLSAHIFHRTFLL